MKKSFAFFLLLTAMVSQAAPKGGYPVLVPFPITEDPCAVQPEKFPKGEGIVKWFNDTRGFGFIHQVDPTGPDLFVYTKSIYTPNKRLNEGDKVRYEIYPGPKGPTAEIVVLKN